MAQILESKKTAREIAIDFLEKDYHGWHRQYVPDEVSRLEKILEDYYQTRLSEEKLSERSVDLDLYK